MESLWEDIYQKGFSSMDEAEIIERVADCLDKNGAGDVWFSGANGYGSEILRLAIRHKSRQCVKYALSEGASIVTPHFNALFDAGNQCVGGGLARALPIYNMVKKRSLQLYSCHGLTSLHIDCVFVPIKRWSAESKKLLQTAAAAGDRAISTECPIWPGMTPLLLAAKHEERVYLDRRLGPDVYYQPAVEELLDRSVDHCVADPNGNTPLHYLFRAYESEPDFHDFFYTKSMFAPAGKNPFGTCTDFSHFHIACKLCPEELEVVKRYLDQGVSPNLPTLDKFCSRQTKGGIVALHIAVVNECTDLIRLLLEYGADVNRKDAGGRNLIRHWLMKKRSVERYLDNRGDWHLQNSILRFIDCWRLFIENGFDMTERDEDDLSRLLSNGNEEIRRIFRECVLRLRTIDEALVSQNLWDVYLEVSNRFPNDWNEAESYASRCTAESRTLFDLGLRSLLDGTVIVESDFKRDFGWLESFHFDDYPIYGDLLRMRFKRKLAEYEDRRRKIERAAPKIQKLLRSVYGLPFLQAETYMWRLSYKELLRLLKQKSIDE